MFIGVIVASDDGEFLHIESRLLEFLDGRFGSRVRGIDGDNGIVLFMLILFVLVFTK